MTAFDLRILAARDGFVPQVDSELVTCVAGVWPPGDQHQPAHQIR